MHLYDQCHSQPRQAWAWPGEHLSTHTHSTAALAQLKCKRTVRYTAHVKTSRPQLKALKTHPLHYLSENSSLSMERKKARSYAQCSICITRAQEPPGWERESSPNATTSIPQCAPQQAALQQGVGQGEAAACSCVQTYSERVGQKHCTNIGLLCSFHWRWDTCDRKDVQDSLRGDREETLGKKN